jgi:hypothetical protein
VEYPETLSGPHIEATDIALHVDPALRLRTRTVCSTHDHGVAGNDRRGVQTNFRIDQVHLLIVIEAEIDNALLAECGNGNAGLASSAISR